MLPGNHSGLSLGLTATAFTTIDPLAAPDATLDCRRARPERNDPFTDPPLLTTLCALQIHRRQQQRQCIVISSSHKASSTYRKGGGENNKAENRKEAKGILVRRVSTLLRGLRLQQQLPKTHKPLMPSLLPLKRIGIEIERDREQRNSSCARQKRRRWKRSKPLKCNCRIFWSSFRVVSL